MKKGNIYEFDGDVAYCLLAGGSRAIVSAGSVENLKQHTWCLGGNGYVMTRSCEPAISMQRFLVNAKPGEVVDHIDRNPLNNTLDNLRCVTKRKNAINTDVRSDNTSGCKGVSYHKRSGKYRAYLTIDSKQHHLGLFDNLNDAVKARLLGLRQP